MFWKSIQRNFVGFFLLVLAFGTAVTHAQTGTTSLRGTVTDKSGGAIVGAKAVLRSSEKALTREIHTSNTGAHEFSALPPGNYILTIEATGFRKY